MKFYFLKLSRWRWLENIGLLVCSKRNSIEHFSFKGTPCKSKTFSSITLFTICLVETFKWVGRKIVQGTESNCERCNIEILCHKRHNYHSQRISKGFLYRYLKSGSISLRTSNILFLAKYYLAL